MSVMVQQHVGSGTLPRSVRRIALCLRMIFATSFLIFFVAAVIDLFLPRAWRLLPQSGARKSVFAEARDAAKTATNFASMG